MLPQMHISKFVLLAIMLTIVTMEIGKVKSIHLAADHDMNAKLNQENLDTQESNRPRFRAHRNDPNFPDEKLAIAGRNLDSSIHAAVIG